MSLVLLGCRVDTPFTLSYPGSGSSLAPRFFSSSQGDHFLSWLETPDDSLSQLYFAPWTGSAWLPKRLIATGPDWFVNWADFPSVTIHHEDPDFWIAHWLQYTASGTYDYEIRMSISINGGRQWSPSFVPHLDGIDAEHGFVSVSSEGADHFRAVWLDGRNTKSDTTGTEAHDHGGGPMTLRTARIDRQGHISQDQELDGRICDCCQTSMVDTPFGQLVAYRDRDENEIRDISLLRLRDTGWSQPEYFSQDGWKITGCPVNGPALSRHNSTVALAWFTQANDTAQVKLAISQDGGLTFGPRRVIDQGDPMGRVHTAICEHGILISWLEATAGDKAELLIKLFDTEGNDLGIQYRQAIAPERASGFPQLHYLGQDQLLIAWTEAERERTRVATRLITLSPPQG